MILKMTVMLPSLVHAIIPGLRPPTSTKIMPPPPSSSHLVTGSYDQSIDEFLQEMRSLFEKPLTTTNLLGMSTKLQEQFTERLQTCRQTMLPSYIHTLPSGQEKGNYLALDVGGSTFRVALVELRGADGDRGIEIKKMTSSIIDNKIRMLEGRAFFDWMAARIFEMLAQYDVHMGHESEPLPMGLAWSFPIEQTSLRSGKLHPMGKAFFASRGLEGQDLADLIIDACKAKHLNVRMDAIVNDSSATLLSRAYFDASTRVALILGTGTNAALHMPVGALHSGKYGQRPASWHARAAHVLVNTEFSMCGAGLLPTTRYDEHIDAHHSAPGYQPYEHLIGGRYLGEIVRLVLLDAVRSAGVFNGIVPPSLLEPYALHTETLARVESDTTPGLAATREAMESAHPLPHGESYRLADAAALHAITRLVTRRAAALLGVAIHALWALRTRAESTAAAVGPRTAGEKLVIACNGSVIERYPGFRARTQAVVDQMLVQSAAAPGERVELQIAGESAIFGAAVAAACVGAESREEIQHEEEARYVTADVALVDGVVTA